MQQSSHYSIQNGLVAAIAVSAAIFGGSGFAQSGVQPPVTAASDRFAMVNSNGTLFNGGGAVSSTHLGAANSGVYNVIFNRDVSQCVYIASIALPTPLVTSPVPPAGQIGASRIAANVNGIAVTTKNSAGFPADLPFHLFIGC